MKASIVKTSKESERTVTAEERAFDSPNICANTDMKKGSQSN